MKKLISILLIVLLTISLSACNDKVLRIELAALTEEESNILSLLGNDSNSKIFEYTVDEMAKSYHVKIYTLDENLKWKEKVSSFGQIRFKGQNSNFH